MPYSLNAAAASSPINPLPMTTAMPADIFADIIQIAKPNHAGQIIFLKRGHGRVRSGGHNRLFNTRYATRTDDALGPQSVLNKGSPNLQFTPFPNTSRRHGLRPLQRIFTRLKRRKHNAVIVFTRLAHKQGPVIGRWVQRKQCFEHFTGAIPAPMMKSFYDTYCTHFLVNMNSYIRNMP